MNDAATAPHADERPLCKRWITLVLRWRKSIDAINDESVAFP